VRVGRCTNSGFEVEQGVASIATLKRRLPFRFWIPANKIDRQCLYARLRNRDSHQEHEDSERPINPACQLNSHKIVLAAPLYALRK
jgi:hypothetical protein